MVGMKNSMDQMRRMLLLIRDLREQLLLVDKKQLRLVAQEPLQQDQQQD